MLSCGRHRVCAKSSACGSFPTSAWSAGKLASQALPTAPTLSANLTSCNFCAKRRLSDIEIRGPAMVNDSEERSLQAMDGLDPAPRKYAPCVRLLRRRTFDPDPQTTLSAADVESWLLGEAHKTASAHGLKGGFASRLVCGVFARVPKTQTFPCPTRHHCAGCCLDSKRLCIWDAAPLPASA